MRLGTRFGAVVAVACSALVTASVALAAAAGTKVTINGPDSVYGSIFSSRTSCLANRKVIAFQQKGSTQNPKVDKKMDTTTSFKEGSHGAWDMGNPGFPAHHKYYAEATKTTSCKAGFSKSLYFK